MFEDQRFRFFLKHWPRKMSPEMWRHKCQAMSTLGYTGEFFISARKAIRYLSLNTCSNCAKKWHRNISDVSDDPLSRLARPSFGPSQNPRVNGSVIWYSPVYWGVDIRELEQRHFWATHVNRKRSIFPFNMPWLYKICIPNGLFSYRDDLPRRKIAKRALPVDVRHSKTSLLNKLPNIVYAVKKLRRTSRLKYRVKRANILNDPVWTKWPLKFCSRSKIRSVPCERSSHSLRYNILPKECTIQADCVQHSSLFIKCRTKVICVLFIAITIQKGTFLLN